MKSPKKVRNEGTSEEVGTSRNTQEHAGTCRKKWGSAGASGEKCAPRRLLRVPVSGPGAFEEQLLKLFPWTLVGDFQTSGLSRKLQSFITTIQKTRIRVRTGENEGTGGGSFLSQGELSLYES